MIWQLWVLIALFASIAEEIIDKSLMVRNKLAAPDGAVDSHIIGAFYRNLTFWLFVVIAVVLGIFGPLYFFVPWPLILLGATWPLSSIIYHHFLRTQSLSRISGVSFVFPFLLIMVDRYLFAVEFSLLQIFGFLILLTGGILISFQFSKKNLQTLTPKIWALLFIKFLFGAATYIIYKFYADHPEMNEISFYFWTWLVTNLTFIGLIFWQKESHLLLKIATQDNFFAKTSVAKFFDFIAGIATLKALTLASVTEVKILESAYPLVLIMSIFILNRVFRLHLEEDFSHVNLVLKVTAMLLLTAGSIIIVQQG